MGQKYTNWPTINGFTLCQVGVVLAGQKAVPIPSDNALDVPRIISTLFIHKNYRYTNPPFTLKKRPSMVCKMGMIGLGRGTAVAPSTLYGGGPYVSHSHMWLPLFSAKFLAHFLDSSSSTIKASTVHTFFPSFCRLLTWAYFYTS